MPEEIIIANIAEIVNAITAAVAALTASWEGIAAELINQMGGMIQFLPLVFFSVLAFWRPQTLLFLLVAGCGIMVAFNWYDTYTNSVGLGISLMLMAYSLVSLGFALKVMFWKESEE